MNSPSNNSGVRPFRTATGEAAETPAWPVLASLPRVGAERERVPAAMYLDATVDDAAERTSNAPALRIAMPADAPEEFEPLALAPPAERGTIEFRTFIDQPHLAVRGYDWPVASERRMPAGPAPSAAPPSTYRRIDAGSPRTGDSAPSKSPSSRPAERSRPSLATKIFQLHAAAAPHAGVIMTLALAVSVGLLCWFTMGRPPAATNYDRVLDAPGGWPAETATTPLPEGAAGVSAAPDQFVSEFAWRMTPASEPATAADEDKQSPPAAATPGGAAMLAAPKLELNDPPATSADVASAQSTPPSPADEAPAAEAAAPSIAAAAAPAPAPPVEGAAAKSPEPITPTPHAHAFPTTPYGAFNYFAAPATATSAAGAAAEQPSVASRPAEASAAPTAVR